MAMTTLVRSAALIATIFVAPAAFADDIDNLPINVIFTISSGFWTDPGEAPTPGNAQNTAAAARRGYYKLVAIRQPDRTAKVYLQQVAVLDSGLRLVDSVELEELTALKPYVTDIRPEDSTGVSRQPGLMATVYLKTDPASLEPESWTVLIDEFGDISVEKATN